jgi:hypothetical protein
MPIASIRRRIVALESVIAVVPEVDYPPLTPLEIEAVARRAQMGQRLTRDEAARLSQHSPIIAGELLITAHRGLIWVKRYGGVDLEEI